MCYSNLRSPQIPTEHTADRIPHCCHHVLKQCQCDYKLLWEMDQKQPQLYLTSEEIVSFIFLLEGYASLTEPNGT